MRSAAAELCTSGHQSAVDFRSFAEAAQQVEELTKAELADGWGWEGWGMWWWQGGWFEFSRYMQV